uniref:Signal recognition particle 19 kDa protein n=1 Tax=Cryptomonas curvata TaxID=233186 RepID=A0A7S0M5N2_9CRYP|mmetsp:Transcript_2312/g.4795  ORF Transcript_2312/g.4795 Transcript_2312/m.4795 type:complete len:153 (+) Transcript_2312:11-469(+)
MAATAVPTLHEKHGTVVIYSPYINKHKSIQEGRRISVAQACEDPSAWEILEVCKRLFPEDCVDAENKGYSRDYEAQWPPMRGRIRVRLFDDKGKPTNPELTSRKQLFIKVAELIPKIASRQPGYQDPQYAAMAASAGELKLKSGNKKKNRKR